ncbi:hypothetical protein RYH80_18480 [Halobaculum sp. MBLA0147]|uniref:hypothetical protein n=1 Tax=Halobaculum sp. MBLA0147 TaxID=3079934 RepID=UPI0035259500
MIRRVRAVALYGGVLGVGSTSLVVFLPGRLQLFGLLNLVVGGIASLGYGVYSAKATEDDRSSGNPLLIGNVSREQAAILYGSGLLIASLCGLGVLGLGVVA